MKLTVLCDNNTFIVWGDSESNIDRYMFGEPAFSVYIENGDDKILYDLGYSDIFKKNAEILGIDLKKVNKIAFSHGHNDHTRGLKYFDLNNSLEVYAGKGCFDKKYFEDIDVSAPYSLNEMSEKCKVITCDEPIEISKNLYFCSNISRVNDFETLNPALFALNENNKKEIDKFTDDSILVYNGEEGLTIITGCSHIGICNIIDYACKTFKTDKVNAVIGGFHLMKLNNMALKTIGHLKQKNIKQLYPGHCTVLDVKSEMKNQGLNVKEVGTGLVLNFK